MILSRKGFDSAAGGVPSPILEDGQLVSIPIPEERGSVAYTELRHRGIVISRLLSDLRPDESRRCHLDPDIDPSALPHRPSCWRPAFGQSDAAAQHLDRTGVGEGDLFLFFGWFRQIESIAGVYRYAKGAPDLHVLWGWLQVDEILTPRSAMKPSGFERHPHFDGRRRNGSRVYVGHRNGGGVFRSFHARLVLTEPGQSRSRWRIPSDFMPCGRPALTYHANSDRWRGTRDACLLSTVGRGQEFVLDTDQYPKIRAWAENLVECAG